MVLGDQNALCPLSGYQTKRWENKWQKVFMPCLFSTLCNSTEKRVPTSVLNVGTPGLGYRLQNWNGLKLEAPEPR